MDNRARKAAAAALRNAADTLLRGIKADTYRPDMGHQPTPEPAPESSESESSQPAPAPAAEVDEDTDDEDTDEDDLDDDDDDDLDEDEPTVMGSVRRAGLIKAAKSITVTLPLEKAVKIAGLEREWKAVDNFEPDSRVEYEEDETQEEHDERMLAWESEQLDDLFNYFISYLEEWFNGIQVDRDADVSAEYDDGAVDITITNPDLVFRTIIEGVGDFGVGEEDFTDKRTVLAHLPHLASFYEVYGARPPRWDPN